METVTYQGNVYSDHTIVPFDKEDQKFIKQMSNWGKPDKLKDKRAPKIQYCYALILKKGIKDIPVSPDKYWLDKEDLRPFANWLELDVYTTDLYLEPLRVAINIYLENNSI